MSHSPGKTSVSQGDERDVSIVMPAYQEARNLEAILPRLREVLRPLNLRYEILVIDTMTPMDDTARVCNSLGACCIPRRGGNNYGDAVRTGIESSRGKWVVFMDSDGSHTPEFVKTLLDHADGNDIVVASRYIRGGSTDNPFVLVMLSYALNITYRFFFGLACHDVSNSFRLYRGDLLRSLTLSCSHFDVVEEILIQLYSVKHELKLLELPFRFEKRMEGQTKRNLLVFIRHYIQTMARLKRIQKQTRSRRG